MTDPAGYYQTVAGILGALLIASLLELRYLRRRYGESFAARIVITIWVGITAVCALGLAAIPHLILGDISSQSAFAGASGRKHLADLTGTLVSLVVVLPLGAFLVETWWSHAEPARITRTRPSTARVTSSASERVGKFFDEVVRLVCLLLPGR